MLPGAYASHGNRPHYFERLNDAYNGGESKTYRTGELGDVPAGMVHAAKMGPNGCRYMAGEK